MIIVDAAGHEREWHDEGSLGRLVEARVRCELCGDVVRFEPRPFVPKTAEVAL